MTKIDPASLSARWRVVRADPVRFEELFELYRSSREYFDYFSLDATKERLYRDMTMLPDGCSSEQKHFLAYYDNGVLTAILDLIEGFPSARICYIGLFMVSAGLAGCGVGTAVITELCAALSRLGFEAVRLAYGKQYAQAAHFWTKNGFVPLREAVDDEYGRLIVAQKDLRCQPDSAAC